MNKISNKKQNILLDLLYIAIIFTLTNLVGKVINLEIKFFDQLIIVIIISLTIKYFTKYPILLFISLITGFLTMLFINTYKAPIFSFIAYRGSLLLDNLNSNLKGKQAISKENIFIIYLFILISTSTYTSIVIHKKKNIFLLMPIYLFIFLIYWYSFIDEAYNFTAIFLFLFLILLGFRGYKKSKLNNNRIFNRWFTIATIYSIIIVSIAFIMPKSNNYISWPWLQNKVYNTFPLVEDLRYYKEYNRKTADAELFNFSTSGFSSSDSDLGGPLIQSERKVMTVETNESLYLRGNTKHIYTGKSWINMSYEFLEFNSKQDFSELLDTQKDREYIPDTITVTFNSFASKSIFTPYKTVSINLDNTNSNSNSSMTVDNDGIISSKNGIYKNEKYVVDFLRPLPYERLISNRVNKSKKDLLDLDLYLDLPEDVVTDRTKDLTKSLVKNIDNDYLKAITIQNYLRDNYKYNLNVAPLPEGKDFVDYFLFEQKEGYCTYYASAMAIMLRLEDIPTRYVEGYIVDEKIDNRKYQVRQKHAHAWVEAFIEPVGWMTFEPTGAYSPLENTENEEEEIIPDIEEDILPVDEDIENEIKEDIENPIEDEDILVDKKVDKNKSLWKIISLISILVFLLLIFLRVLWRVVKYNCKKIKFNTLQNKEKVIYLYKDIVDLLAILNLPMEKGETHFEYADRITYLFTDITEYKIKDVTDIFVKVKYGNIKAKEEDVLYLLNYREKLNKTVKNKFGKVKYLYRKYINIYFKKKKEIP